MASIIAVWAILWLGIAAVVTVTGLRQRRPLLAAVWLISIGGFLALQEDPLLVLQMASTSHSAGFRDGVLGLVDPHTRGHMYGAAILAVGGIALAVVMAHAALRRGERWAWWSLAAFWLLGTAADVYEVFWIYPHDFPLAATPADGVRGFGWPTIAAWIVIWAAGLAIAAPSVMAARTRALPADAPSPSSQSASGR